MCLLRLLRPQMLVDSILKYNQQSSALGSIANHLIAGQCTRSLQPAPLKSVRHNFNIHCAFGNCFCVLLPLSARSSIAFGYETEEQRLLTGGNKTHHTKMRLEEATMPFYGGSRIGIPYSCLNLGRTKGSACRMHHGPTTSSWLANLTFNDHEKSNMCEIIIGANRCAHECLIRLDSPVSIGESLHNPALFLVALRPDPHFGA